MLAPGFMATSARHATKAQSKRFPLSLRDVVEVAAVVALLVLIVSGVHKLRSPETMPVQQVNFEGHWLHLNREQLKETVRLHLQSAFLAIDLRAIEGSLQALPWVEKASVRRQWPGMLIIHIKEQQPIARWGRDGLLNANAEVFYPNRETQLPTLPVLFGPPGRENELLVQFNKIKTLVNSRGVKLLALIEDDRGSRHLLINRGIRIALGRGDRHGALTRLMRVYRKIIVPQHGAITGIDLRYTNGFSVAWKPSVRDAGETDGENEAS